jgi:hypothetical protein
MKLPGGKSLRQKYLLYIDRETITLYLKGNQKPYVLNLGPEVVKDMEIVSPEQFITSLAIWMDSIKIPSCDFIVVLSEKVYFEYAVQSLAGDGSAEKEIDMYLDTVPFEQSVNRVIVDDATKRVVVLSRDYYDLLLEFLEKRYIRVLALIPATLLKITSPEEIKVDLLIKNLDDYKKYNFLSDFERKAIPDTFIARNSPKDTKHLKLMLGLFGLLLSVLAVVIYFNLIRKG